MGAGYAPTGYGGWTYGAPIDHPQGTTILVLGILSLVGMFCYVGIVLGPVALIMGTKAIREIDANPGYYRNRGVVQAGRVMGGIATGLLALGIVAWIVLLAVSASG